MPFSNGLSIGPYQIIEEIGRGGMATVYKAYHAALDRYVAIKVVQTAYADDINFLSRFQREARVIARLEHANIVPVYDYAQAEGLPYIVMKYINGESLKERLKQHVLTYGEIGQIMEAVGTALTYAHSQNVLHRDIKPANVLIDQQGHYYLADFGLARLVQSSEISLTDGRMIGTPQYMSPEQALSLPNLDRRSDVYSLGIMLYEMLVGRPPFDADTPFTVIHDHIYTPPPLPRTLNVEVPQALEAILSKALQKDPNQRYQDVEALVFAYRAFVAGSSLAGLSAAPRVVQNPDAPRNSIAAPSVSPQSDNDDETQTIEGQFKDSPSPADVALAPLPQQISGKPVAVKKTNPLVFILPIVVLLLLAAGALFVFYQFRSNQTANQEATRTALEQSQLNTLVVAQIKTRTAAPAQAAGSNTEIINMLDEAARLWNAGQTEEALQLYLKAEAGSARDVAFYEMAIKELSDQEAWGLAALSLFSSDRPAITENAANQIDRIHEILYKAAKDANSSKIFTHTPPYTLTLVASIRYKFYFEDQAEAKTSLGKVLDTPLQVKRFPEAGLLEVEMYNQSGDIIKARESLKKLLQGEGNLPEWVRMEAHKLEAVLNS